MADRPIKRFKKRETKPPAETTRKEVPDVSKEMAAFKDPRQLPVLPLEASQQIISNMHRGEERTRSEILYEMEQTIPEPVIEEKRISVEKLNAIRVTILGRCIKFPFSEIPYSKH